MLSAVRQWLVKTARSEARCAWESFKERFGAAAEQAWDAWVDDQATRAKAWFARTPQGGVPVLLSDAVDLVEDDT